MAKRPFGVLRVRIAGIMDEWPIPKGKLNLGRGPDNDVIIDSPKVSRRHATFAYTPQGWQVTDKGSLNGTQINGNPIPRQTPVLLRPGDVVRIGDFEFTLDLPSSGTPLPPQPKVRISSHPGFIVYIGKKSEKFPFDKDVLTLGRKADNDICIDSTVVSGHHARIERVGNAFRIVDLGSTNGLVYNGQRITDKVLDEGDLIYITDKVVLQYRNFLGFIPLRPEMAEVSRPTQYINLKTMQRITIGRAKDNDIVLDHPQVSRYHAVIERFGPRYRIRDLKSTNGTFVNGRRITKPLDLKEGDIIKIAAFKLVLSEEGIRRFDEAGKIRLDALHLDKWVSRERRILRDVSLSLSPGEFVAIVGASGAGKTTLLDALCGLRPANGRKSRVLVNGTDLYRHFDSFRTDLGYVPQDDIIHRELTVYQALNYAAKLRLPADTSPKERRRRIEKVLKDLDLWERRDFPIYKLSGGQRKRVSIGVELLTEPSLFFLDEATSGLDPGMELQMMQLLRRLADQGHTIFLVTHATKNVQMCDKVVFLAKGGYLAFFGPPEEALEYFDRYRSAKERKIKNMEFDDIYIILDDPKRGKPKDWADRFRNSPQYQEYIAKKLAEVKPTPRTPRPGAAGRPGSGAKRISSLKQFWILSARYLDTIRRDPKNLLLMFLIAPVIGLMDFIAWDHHIFDPIKGNAKDAVTMFFLLSLITILVGTITSVREIVKERAIYKRERAVFLKILPYVLSKIWVGFLFALYHSAVLVATKLIKVDFSHIGWGNILGIYITVALSVMSGVLMGLFISAISPSEERAMLLIILVLVPQFIFSGGMLPVEKLGLVGDLGGYLTTSKWALAAMVTQARIMEGDCSTDTQSGIFDRCRVPGIERFKEGIDVNNPSEMAPAEAKATEMVKNLKDQFGDIFSADPLECWIWLIALMLLFFILIVVFQKRKDAEG